MPPTQGPAGTLQANPRAFHPRPCGHQGGPWGQREGKQHLFRKGPSPRPQLSNPSCPSLLWPVALAAFSPGACTSPSPLLGDESVERPRASFLPQTWGASTWGTLDLYSGARLPSDLPALIPNPDLSGFLATPNVLSTNDGEDGKWGSDVTPPAVRGP